MRTARRAPRTPPRGRSGPVPSGGGDGSPGGSGEGHAHPRPPSLSGEVCAIASQEVRSALAEWIPSLFVGEPEPPWFITVTFRRPPNAHYPETALHRVTGHLRRICARPTGFVGCERHLSGDLHIHGLVAPGEVGARRSLAWYELFTRFGRSRVEVPKGVDKVAWYCAKYVTKDLAGWEIL